MIRIFSHYIHRRVLLQVLFDFVLVMAAVLAACFLIAGTKPPWSMSATHGLSLATGIFLINSASGFYQPAHGRSVPESIARAALATLLAVPLAYLLFRLVPAGLGNGGAAALAATLTAVGVILHRVYVAHRGSLAHSRSRILILGTGMAAKLAGDTLRASDPSAEVVGYFRAGNEQQTVVPQAQIVAGQSLRETALGADVDEIVVAVTERRGGAMPMRDLLDCKIRGIQVSDI